MSSNLIFKKKMNFSIARVFITVGNIVDLLTTKGAIFIQKKGVSCSQNVYREMNLLKKCQTGSSQSIVSPMNSILKKCHVFHYTKTFNYTQCCRKVK